MNKRQKKAVAWAAGILGGLTAAYFYQPQRIDFFPVSPPEPNPRMDPDSATLFSPSSRVAIISAHPDDTEFYMGGTLTNLGNSGARILLIVCTDGDKGYYPAFLTNADQNRRVRRLEQLAAAEHYGAEVWFLSEPDGRLQSDRAVIDAIRRKLLEFEPNYVLAFDPIYPPRLQHSDHLEAGTAAERAIKGVPSVSWLLRYSTHAANFFVDISALWSTKLALLTIHKSQFAYEKLGMIANLLRGRAEADGRSAGTTLAEGFRVEFLGGGQKLIP